MTIKQSTVTFYLESTPVALVYNFSMMNSPLMNRPLMNSPHTLYGIVRSVHETLNGVAPIQTGSSGKASHPIKSLNNENGRCNSLRFLYQNVYILIIMNVLSQ